MVVVVVSVVFVVVNGFMMVLGIIDFCMWLVLSWVSDVVLYFGYGVVMVYVLRCMIC